MLHQDEGCKQAAVLVAVWTCPVCFATEGQFDGYVAVGFGPDDVDQLVAGTLPQHRVTKLSPRPANADELRQLFLDSMTLW